MSFFERMLHFLQAEMETPTNFSLFHVCFLLLTLGAAVLLVLRYRNASQRTVRTICLVVWVTIVSLEIYKQLVFSMTVTDGVAGWDYQWYAFPFQFCSSPLYALPFVIFLKDGLLRRFFITFLSTFSLFAGLAVMLYPNDVFIPMIGINIQTMIHHGSQVALGVFLAAHTRKETRPIHLLGAVAVFAAFSAIAMGLNEAVYAYITSRGMDDSFNMFYISPHYSCTLPVLSGIYDKVPYPLFLLIYLLGFGVIAALFFGIEKGVTALAGLKRKKGTALAS